MSSDNPRYRSAGSLDHPGAHGISGIGGIMHQGPSPDPQPPSQSAQPPDYPAQHYFPGSAPRTSPRRPPIDVIVLAISALIIAVLGLWLPLFGSIFAALFFGAMGLGWGPIAVLGLIATLALATAIGE